MASKFAWNLHIWRSNNLLQVESVTPPPASERNMIRLREQQFILAQLHRVVVFGSNKMPTVHRSLPCGLLLTIAFVGLFVFTGQVAAQSASGSFNPQTQLAVGSRLIIRSIYGVGTVRPHYGNGTGQPSYHWNDTIQSLPTYAASLTIDIQITGDAPDGGEQFAVQGGVIAVAGSTIAITGGQGEVSSVDRVMIQATGASLSGQFLNVHMEGLAALYNGALITELTSNVPITINGVQTNIVITYLATIG